MTKNDETAPSRVMIDEEMLNASSYHTNISQNFIVITEDKIRLCLIKYQNILKLRNDWIAPAGIFIALIATLVVASDFKEFLGISPEGWKTFFIFGMIASFVFLLKSLFYIYINRKNDGMETIIQELKESS